MKIRKEIQ